MTRAAIGIGANLGDARNTVENAIARLNDVGRLVAQSSLYRTRPWGVRDQPDFVNAVAVIETDREPAELLVFLQHLEHDLGRTPSIRWGPRAIDLDILTYGQRRIESDRLTIPHPRLRERAFVLVPLAEVDPSYIPVRDALPAAERSGVVALDGSERELKS